MEIKKYICPNCGVEMPYIRYEVGVGLAQGITVFCKKCKQAVPLKVGSKNKNEKK